MKMVPTRAATENTMTRLPMILLMITMPLLSNFSRMELMSQVSPYHHSKAPKTMLKKPMHISNGWFGMTKANCANKARKRKMMSGLENVTKNAVTALCVSEPFLWPLMCMFLVGFVRQQ